MSSFEELFLKISSPRASLIRSGTQTSLVIKCAQSIWREREVKTNFAEERLKTKTGGKGERGKENIIFYRKCSLIFIKEGSE